MRFELRPGGPGDVDGLLELWRAAAENDGRPPDTRPAVAALLDQDAAAVILAEHDGELVGSVRQADWSRWVRAL
jgi:hypothetical protein